MFNVENFTVILLLILTKGNNFANIIYYAADNFLSSYFGTSKDKMVIPNA